MRNARPAPAMVTSAPIFISSRIGPGGITAVAKNKAKTSPIEAVHPTTTSSRQPTRCGRCRPRGDRHAGSRDDADRPSERGDRNRPDAGLEAVKRDAGVDEPEQQEHALPREAATSARTASAYRAPAAPARPADRDRAPVGKERHDRHQRERRMNAARNRAHQDNVPGPIRYSQKFLTPRRRKAAAEPMATAIRPRPMIGCASPTGLKHGHERQADRVGGNRQQEQKWNGRMTPEDQPGDDVAARNIDGTGRDPPPARACARQRSGQTRDSRRSTRRRRRRRRRRAARHGARGEAPRPAAWPPPLPW